MDRTELDGITPEWVAHRAGNDPHLIAPALAVADAVELDVHLFRGRLEVRHSKVLWPFRIYWEQDEGILPRERPPRLASILAATPDDAHLWVDVKGFTPRLTRRVLRAVGDRPVTFSGRSWWVLRAAQRRGVRTFRSVGSRTQLWLALRLTHPDGIGLPERFATPGRLTELGRRCSSIAVWAVREPARAAELRDLGVRTLIIDDLDLVRATETLGEDPSPR